MTATLADAVHASSTAPIFYFDKPAEVTCAVEDGEPVGRRFWDGAISGLNNPAAAAVAEAMAIGHAAAAIGLLSIGTAGNFLPNSRVDRRADAELVEKRGDLFFLRDIRQVATAVLGDPPDFASFLAHTALGGRAPTAAGEREPASSVARLNPALTPESKCVSTR